ncbi:MAG TPA: helix-turn-helix domain-containing protein [Nitrospira sp.]|nr:helix-turn-helix domain-containing protein [Nitrospira sp.]
MTGPQLRSIRRRLGLTQVAMANHIGVAPNSVARWERGEMEITEPVARLVTLLRRSVPSTKAKDRG